MGLAVKVGMYADLIKRDHAHQIEVFANILKGINEVLKEEGFKKFNVRIFGIDCDELRGGNSITRENGLRAKKYVEKLVLGKIVKIEVLNNKIIDGKKLREKFGRLLAKITTPEGHDLGDELFIAGLARRYYGGRKDNTVLVPKVDISVHSDDNKHGSDRDTVEY